MTEKLYYSDSHIHEFSARVTSCREDKSGYAVTLDKTAFFPGGGGQKPDAGFIGPVRVTGAEEKAGEILHYTDAPLEDGAEYACRLDWETCLRRMQNHSGEHVLSGTLHRLYGVSNVGFHMGEDFMTIDFDRELTREELMRAEYLANETVRADVPVRAWFPSPDELKTIDYRSKLELTENVRIVEIPGADTCACCAPHVKRTGEIGLIKILDFERFRAGVRLCAVCGMDALDAVRIMQDNVGAVSRLLSARRAEIGAAAARLAAENERLKARTAELGMEAAALMAEKTAACDGNICIFDNKLDELALRELANRLADKCTGFAAVFSGADGTGWRYIIISRHVDLKAKAREINAAINGRGGGSREMLQGRAMAAREMIENFVL